MRERPISTLPFDTSERHAASSAELEELATVFVLGADVPEERDLYEAHLAGCELCRQLVAQFQSTTELLSEALGEEEASPALKGRILAQARRELAMEEPSLSKGLRWPAWIRPKPLGFGAAVAAVLVGIVAWNVILQVRLADRGDVVFEQQQFIDAIAQGGQVFRLAGTEAEPDATAALVQAPETDRSILVVRDLPKLPRGREYQVWRIKDDVPAGAGTFASLGEREQLFTLSTDFSGADAIGVSVEPAGGSFAPTGDIVLLGIF